MNGIAISIFAGLVVAGFCFIMGIGALSGTKEDKGAIAVLWFICGILLGGTVAFAGCSTSVGRF